MMKPQASLNKAVLSASSATAFNNEQQSSTSLTSNVLREENVHYQGRGGVSQENRALGFRPAFIDKSTGVVYLSRFTDGRLAPMHLLDGLPAEVVLERDSHGHVTLVKPEVEAGFYKAGFYYSREAASAEAEGRSLPEQAIYSHIIL